MALSPFAAAALQLQSADSTAAERAAADGWLRVCLAAPDSWPTVLEAVAEGARLGNPVVALQAAHMLRRKSAKAAPDTSLVEATLQRAGAVAAAGGGGPAFRILQQLGGAAARLCPPEVSAQLPSQLAGCTADPAAAVALLHGAADEAVHCTAFATAAPAVAELVLAVSTAAALRCAAAWIEFCTDSDANAFAGVGRAAVAVLTSPQAATDLDTAAAAAAFVAAAPPAPHISAQLPALGVALREALRKAQPHAVELGRAAAAVVAANATAVLQGAAEGKPEAVAAVALLADAAAGGDEGVCEVTFGSWEALRGAARRMDDAQAEAARLHLRPSFDAFTDAVVASARAPPAAGGWTGDDDEDFDRRRAAVLCPALRDAAALTGPIGFLSRMCRALRDHGDWGDPRWQQPEAVLWAMSCVSTAAAWETAAPHVLPLLGRPLAPHWRTTQSLCRLLPHLAPAIAASPPTIVAAIATIAQGLGAPQSANTAAAALLRLVRSQGCAAAAAAMGADGPVVAALSPLPLQAAALPHQARRDVCAAVSTVLWALPGEGSLSCAVDMLTNPPLDTAAAALAAQRPAEAEAALRCVQAAIECAAEWAQTAALDADADGGGQQARVAAAWAQRLPSLYERLRACTTAGSEGSVAAACSSAAALTTVIPGQGALAVSVAGMLAALQLHAPALTAPLDALGVVCSAHAGDEAAVPALAEAFNAAASAALQVVLAPAAPLSATDVATSLFTLAARALQRSVLTGGGRRRSVLAPALLSPGSGGSAVLSAACRCLVDGTVVDVPCQQSAVSALMSAVGAPGAPVWLAGDGGAVGAAVAAAAVAVSVRSEECVPAAGRVLAGLRSAAEAAYPAWLQHAAAAVPVSRPVLGDPAAAALPPPRLVQHIREAAALVVA
eukprot:TRINITY_DN1654_c1_g1_i1.p1 TRINITY_DN1654_c1_g1~~TRINITY_DN1654_c1_g1_i1.p1  ORF type:complete len:917 (+),score=338.25 TRINITY_DN1654_c1_g1_i1:55-2751(+)